MRYLRRLTILGKGLPHPHFLSRLGVRVCCELRGPQNEFGSVFSWQNDSEFWSPHFQWRLGLWCWQGVLHCQWGGAWLVSCEYDSIVLCWGWLSNVIFIEISRCIVVARRWRHRSLHLFACVWSKRDASCRRLRWVVECWQFGQWRHPTLVSWVDEQLVWIVSEGRCCHFQLHVSVNAVSRPSVVLSINTMHSWTTHVHRPAPNGWSNPLTIP